MARYFTRENAVLWVAGDGIPAGLRLDLPGGVRQPAPVPSDALPVTRAFFPGSANVLAWETVVPRAARSAVFAGVLERAMFRELRQEAGLSYTAHTDYEPMGADRAIVTAVADSLPEKNGAVLGAFADVLAALRVGRIDDADVATVVRQRVEALQHAEEQGARLPGQALNLVVGPEGVSLVRGEDIATVRFDACAIARAWPDGARQFVGHDGIVVIMEPPRDPDRIPHPQPRSGPTATHPAVTPAAGSGTGGRQWHRHPPLRPSRLPRLSVRARRGRTMGE